MPTIRKAVPERIIPKNGPPPEFDSPLDEESLAAQFGDAGPGVASPPRSAPGGARPASGKAAPAGRAIPSNSLEKKLTEFYERIGGIVLLFDPTCGTAIAESAGDMAHSMVELANTNPAVKRALMSLLEKSAIGMVIAAHLPVALAIAAHHTALPQVVGKRILGAEADDATSKDIGEKMVETMLANLRKAKLAA